MQQFPRLLRRLKACSKRRSALHVSENVRPCKVFLVIQLPWLSDAAECVLECVEGGGVFHLFLEGMKRQRPNGKVCAFLWLTYHWGKFVGDQGHEDNLRPAEESAICIEIEVVQSEPLAIPAGKLVFAVIYCIFGVDRAAVIALRHLLLKDIEVLLLRLIRDHDLFIVHDLEDDVLDAGPSKFQLVERLHALLRGCNPARRNIVSAEAYESCACAVQGRRRDVREDIEGDCGFSYPEVAGCLRAISSD